MVHQRISSKSTFPFLVHPRIWSKSTFRFLVHLYEYRQNQLFHSWFTNEYCQSLLSDSLYTNEYHQSIILYSWYTNEYYQSQIFIFDPRTNIVKVYFSFLGIPTNNVKLYIPILGSPTNIVKFKLKTQLFYVNLHSTPYFLPLGILLAYLSSIFWVMSPTRGVCVLLRLSSPIATSLIYVALALKTIRLYRIFTASRKSAKKPKFISPKSQVVLTLAITSIPVS